MDTQGGGRKRAATKTSAEDQALDQIAKEAEARLAARRQARAEARDIRMREVERQQKEAEHGSPAGVEPVVRTTPRTRTVNHSSRRSSEDSLEDGGSLRDTRMELKELEEKFRKAMIQNAQLDNEKASLGYQLGLLKDQSEDLLEAHTQLGREHRDKCRAHDQLARANHRLGEELALANAAWAERDRLIAERGLAIAGDGDERCLVSVDAANTLAAAGQGSLDVRLSRLAEERADLADQLRRAHAELSERRRDPAQAGAAQGAAKGDADEEEANREAARMLQETRFRLQKADQDVATLQATVARLESQVVRYKASSESSELAENELKVERRKLQRHDVDEEAATERKGSDDEEDVASEKEGDSNPEGNDVEKEGDEKEENGTDDVSKDADKESDENEDNAKDDEGEDEIDTNEINDEQIADSKVDQGIIYTEDVNIGRSEKNNSEDETGEGVDNKGNERNDADIETNGVIEGKEEAAESSEEEESDEESEDEESSEEGSTAGGSSSR